MSDDQRWVAAANGLELHRTGVLVRVVVVILAVMILVWQLVSPRAGEVPDGLGILLGAGEMFGTLLALLGIAKFSAAIPKRGGDLTSVAVLCLAGVLIAEGYVLWIAWRMMDATSELKHGRFPSHDLLHKAEQLPTIAIVVGIAGLVGVLVILSSLASVGRELGDAPLSKRAGNLMVAVVGLAITYGVVSHWMEQVRSVSRAIAIGACLVVFGITVMVHYIGILSWAIQRMRSKSSELPVARVVDGG